MTASEPIPPTIAWGNGCIELIDQRELPVGRHDRVPPYICRTVDELCVAIRDLVVRGAPALEVAGAFGVALAKANGDDVEKAAAQLIATRPTAVNLERGVTQALQAADPLATALQLAKDDVERNRRIGEYGARLITDGARIYTHCNAGALACVGYGTALGVVRAAHEQGKQPTCWVGETRPALQGARLTAWELDRLNIPGTLVADVMAGALMARRQVDCVIVGADRIAANGDVANKIGTYGLAVLAHHHGVPLYVAAPTSTVDETYPVGAGIPIETRVPTEVTEFRTVPIAPAGFVAENWAFDITPADLVTAIITEEGVATAPYGPALAALVAKAQH